MLVQEMTHDADRQVFEVMQVERVTEDTWKVRGRNYKDVRIGDILYAHVDHDVKGLPFEIVEIRAFGKILTELSYGYASELIVSGRDGDCLNKISHLITGGI